MDGQNDMRRWIATSVKPSGRYDDIFFVNETLGWVVGGAENIVLRTDDGGRTWSDPVRLPDYPRAIGMRDAQVGWIGCIGGKPPLYHTTDGGRSWQPVRNLPTERRDRNDADAPPAVCGLQVFDKDRIFAAGTNFPLRPARFLCSLDGGRSWKARDMEDHATILVDIWFTSPTEGWVVGGRGTRPHSLREDVVPVVLKTEDGGQTWRDMLSPDINPPLGEWGWKIQFVTDRFIVVACENFKEGAILISQDGGTTWRRQEIRNSNGEMVNANLEGIGFLNEQVGWVGGWGDRSISCGRTSETRDGGASWQDKTCDWPVPLDYRNGSAICDADRDKGQYINRFRFVRGVGYASGNSVYKYTDEPESAFGAIGSAARHIFVHDGPLHYDRSAKIPVVLKEAAGSLCIHIYDRFGDKVRTLVDETDPLPGERMFEWDLCDDAGDRLPVRQFQVRVAVDDEVECCLLFHRADPSSHDKQGYAPFMLSEA